MLTDEEYGLAMARITVLLDQKHLDDADGKELVRLACDAQEYERVKFPFPDDGPPTEPGLETFDVARRESDRPDDELDAFADFVFRPTAEHPGGVPWMRTLRGWIAAYRAERDAHVHDWQRRRDGSWCPACGHVRLGVFIGADEDVCLYRTFDDGGNATSLFCGLPRARHG